MSFQVPKSQNSLEEEKETVKNLFFIGLKFRAILFLSFVFLFLFAYYLVDEQADVEGKLGHN